VVQRLHVLHALEHDFFFIDVVSECDHLTESGALTVGIFTVKNLVSRHRVRQRVEVGCLVVSVSTGRLKLWSQGWVRQQVVRTCQVFELRLPCLARVYVLYSNLLLGTSYQLWAIVVR